jgi:hypothetical protein
LVLPRSFDAEILHFHHHGADELVSSLKTNQFILPVRLIKEDNVEDERVYFLDIPKLGEDLVLVLSLLGYDEIKQGGPQTLDLLNGSAKLDDNRHSLS